MKHFSTDKSGASRIEDSSEGHSNESQDNLMDEESQSPSSPSKISGPVKFYNDNLPSESSQMSPTYAGAGASPVAKPLIGRSKTNFADSANVFTRGGLKVQKTQKI